MTLTPTTRTLCPTRMRRMATTMARGVRERSPPCPTTVSVPWEWRTGAAWQVLSELASLGSCHHSLHPLPSLGILKCF